MKTFVVWENLSVPAYILNSNVDGVSLAIDATVLFNSTGGFNASYVPTLRAAINKIKAPGKKVTLAFLFGNNSGRAITDHYPCIEFVRKKSQNPDNPSLPVKIPVPFDPGYISKITEIITALAAELKKDAATYSAIEYIKITGANEITGEMRFTGADYSKTNDLAVAYVDAAIKWLASGYTNQKAIDCCESFITIFKNNFPDKILIQEYIPVLNGFPCIDDNNFICPPELRPDLKEEIILFGQILTSNFRAMYTAYDLPSKVPSYTTCLQLNRSKLGHADTPPTLEYFSSVIDKAKAAGYEYLEIFNTNILNYPTLYNG